MERGAEEEIWRKLHELKRAGRVPSLLDIARYSVEAGLSLNAAVQVIQRAAIGRFTARSSELHSLIPSFVAELCLKANSKNVLEYSGVETLATASLKERRPTTQLTLIARDAHFADALRLIAGAEAAVFSELSSTSVVGEMDAIICSPAIGPSPSTLEGDSFGGEIIRSLGSRLSKDGLLCWITGRGILFNRRASHTLSALQAEGLHIHAIIDLANGALPGTAIEGVLLTFKRELPVKRLVGTLRDPEAGPRLANAIIAGPSKIRGSGWTWLDAGDERTYAAIEREELIRKLLPKGRYEKKALRDLLLHGRVDRADKEIPETDVATSFLFVPEYAGSRVTADLEKQTVKPAAIFRFAIDPTLCNPRFLAQMLNGPYGRTLREAGATGATIQRVRLPDLLELEFPLPPILVQDKIVRLRGDIALLQATFSELESTLNQDWTAVSAAIEKVDALKGVLDIEKQIADWWRELPYPLATIYRRYQVSINPKDRLDTLLHFFEMAAVYLAAVGASYVKAMRHDWQEVFARWLHPTGSAGIKRADFGFWIGLAGASLKDVSRITSDKDLRSAAVEIAGLDLVESSSSLGALKRATVILDVARRYRNSAKGHGGHMKAIDAARLDAELQQQIRDLYEATAATFRKTQLVRPGTAEVLDTTLRYNLERLTGSDPTFATEIVEINKPVKSNTLAFWSSDTNTMCRAVPFFRLGAPQQPRESSFYVFNRVEGNSFRWISYQEAREQEFVASDEELQGMIALGSPP